MSFIEFAAVPPHEAPRAFIARSGVLLSGAAIALLAGRDALAKGNASTEADARILNTALGAELEAIAAYQVGAESELLRSHAGARGHVPGSSQAARGPVGEDRHEAGRQAGGREGEVHVPDQP